MAIKWRAIGTMPCDEPVNYMNGLGVGTWEFGNTAVDAALSAIGGSLSLVQTFDEFIGEKATIVNSGNGLIWSKSEVGSLDEIPQNVKDWMTSQGWDGFIGGLTLSGDGKWLNGSYNAEDYTVGDEARAGIFSRTYIARNVLLKDTAGAIILHAGGLAQMVFRECEINASFPTPYNKLTLTVVSAEMEDELIVGSRNITNTSIVDVFKRYPFAEVDAYKNVTRSSTPATVETSDSKVVWTTPKNLGASGLVYSNPSTSDTDITVIAAIKVKPDVSMTEFTREDIKEAALSGGFDMDTMPSVNGNTVSGAALLYAPGTDTLYTIAQKCSEAYREGYSYIYNPAYGGLHPTVKAIYDAILDVDCKDVALAYMSNKGFPYTEGAGEKFYEFADGTPVTVANGLVVPALSTYYSGFFVDGKVTERVEVRRRLRIHLTAVWQNLQWGRVVRVSVTGASGATAAYVNGSRYAISGGSVDIPCAEIGITSQNGAAELDIYVVAEDETGVVQSATVAVTAPK